MGQPIHLVRDGEKTVVYGPNQARLLKAQGWEPADEVSAAPTMGVDDLTAIKGVGPAVALVLADAGYRTYITVAEAPTDKLVALDKISPKTVKTIQESAAAIAAKM